MSLPAWQATIVKDNGDVLPGAEVTIVNEATGLNATIYSDRAGTVGKSNPFFADAEGFAQFYAAPGEYRITAVEAGSGTTRVWRYVPLVEKPNLIYNKQNILGTVSQTSGVPTGAIIERGSNVNGEYVKFADGTLICTGKLTFTGGTTISTGSLFRLSTFYTWAYPSEFTTQPNVSAGNTDDGLFRWVVNSSTAPTTTSARFLVLSSVNDTSNGAFSVMAVGRWF